MRYVLSESAARRTAKAVRKVEKQPLGRPRGRRPDVIPADEFWVELTAEGTGATAGMYSWKLIYPAPQETSGWKDASPAVTGTLNAREANGTLRLTGMRVKLRFNGHTASNQPRFLFVAELPRGTGRYKVLMILDDITPGTWVVDWPRFH